MHSEECRVMSGCVMEALDYSEYTVIKSAWWFVQTLNLFLNCSLLWQLLVSLPLWSTNHLSTRRSLSLAKFRHVGQKYGQKSVEGFQQSHVVHIYVVHSCGVTTVDIRLVWKYLQLICTKLTIVDPGPDPQHFSLWFLWACLCYHIGPILRVCVGIRSNMALYSPALLALCTVGYVHIRPSMSTSFSHYRCHQLTRIDADVFFWRPHRQI